MLGFCLPTDGQLPKPSPKASCLAGTEELPPLQARQAATPAYIIRASGPSCGPGKQGFAAQVRALWGPFQAQAFSVQILHICPCAQTLPVSWNSPVLLHTGTAQRDSENFISRCEMAASLQ